MAGLQWLCGMLSQKANTSGYYPNMHVGEADALNPSGNRQNMPIQSQDPIDLDPIDLEPIDLQPIEKDPEEREVIEEPEVIDEPDENAEVE